MLHKQLYHYTSRAVRTLREKKRITIGVAIFLVLITSVAILQKKPTALPEPAAPAETAVRVATPAELLTLQQTPITFVGEVRSASQAELRSQASGEVVGVYATAGNTVQAGTLLAEIENATERAQLAQAQAALAQAEAVLAKVESGARSEDVATTETEALRAKEQLDTAITEAGNAYTNALSLAENAVFAQADTFFANANTTLPTFRLRSADTGDRNSLEKQRVEIGKQLNVWRENTTTTQTIPEQMLTEAVNTTETIRTFLTTIANLVSLQTPEMADATTRATQSATMLTARSNATAAQSALSGAQQNIRNARAAYTTAALQEERTATGERGEDIAANRAQVDQARAGVAAAVAALERKRIRTPIAGTLSTLNVATGDFVNAQESIAVVSGNSDALQVESFVSDSILEHITQDAEVRVFGTQATGTVVSVAPGLDPTTKQARVLVALADTTTFTRGSFVTLSVLPTHTEASQTPERLPVPLTALKVTPSGLELYTVTIENVVATMPITEGPLVGDVMLLPFTSLPSDTRILLDARGHTAGEVMSITHI